MVCAALTCALPAAGAEEKGRIPAHPRELRFAERRFEVPEAEPYRHVLGNGVPVYVAEDRSLPLVDIAVALRAGEYLDPPEKVGLAALTASMLRRGGTETLSPEALDERLDSLAVELSTGAGRLRAGASLSATAWTLEEALDLLFEVLRRPRFDPGRLALAKDNLRENLKHRNDDPLEVLGREWSWLLYGNAHFTTRPLVPEHLAAISREDLAAFHRRTWHPGGMVVAVSGAVETAAILAALERRFSGWERGESAPWPPPSPQHRPRPGLYHVEKDIPQAKVALGHLGARRAGWDDPEFFALTVMGEVLGGGAVSRVAGRLRTVEGLSYRAGASFGVGDLWPGELRIHVETANATVPLAARLALEEVERLRSQAPGEEEMNLARRSILNAFPLLFDTAEEIAGYFAEDEFLGRPHRFWRDYQAGIERVSAEDVRRAAERHLHPEEMLILTLGRWAEIERGDAARRGAIAAFYDGAVTRLPERDPLTLAPVR
jgi:predicted Zn-dependent peptidase